MKLKGAIFDLDGVIVNTVGLHFKAWRKMFSEYGKKFTFEDYKEKVDGIPRSDGARAILTGLSDEELEEASARKQKYFLELLKKEGVKTYPGTIELIKELREKKIKVAVISASKNCLTILKKAQLDSFFEAVISGLDITRGKPDPQVFLMAKDRLGLKEDECLVFEDAVLGVEAAKRGKFKCVGIDRYNDPARLKKADLVVSDLSKTTLDKLREL
jgi:beta-phosphoglucomutase